MDMRVTMKEKKSAYLLFFICTVFLVLSGSPLLSPQQETEQQEMQEEFVQVINAEVIVRAMRKGKPVSGLQQSDFVLYENGREREITSFMEVRRKIGAEPVEAAEETAAAGDEDAGRTPKKRFFLLYFWLTNPDPRHNETLDHFFNSVYREGDYALIVIGNQVYKITRKQAVPRVLGRVKAKLDAVTGQGKLERELFLRRLEELLKNFEREFALTDASDFRGQDSRRALNDPDYKKNLLEQFITNYKRFFDEYRYKNINVNVDKLKGIAQSLKAVNFEKWGLVFFQHDIFPQFDPERFIQEKQLGFGTESDLRRILQSFTRELSKPATSMAILEDIRQAFIGANATFHLLLSNVSIPGEQLHSRFIKTGHVYSDWQEIFRSISQATGGEVIDGKKPDKSLDQAVDKEDIYYRLTYAPQIAGKTLEPGEAFRDIEVKTPKKRINLVYNRQVKLREPNKIAIDDFSFTFPTLQFTLKNYQQLFDGYQMYGNIRVKVAAVDEEGEVSIFKKVFEPEEVEITPAMKMNFTRGGKYTLIIEALDNQTGRKVVFSQKVEVPKTGLEGPTLITRVHEKAKDIDKKKGRLGALLEKAADYCEKLKRVTFYFTCKEEISDIYVLKGVEVKNDFYRHDYQILMDETGRMFERRENVEEETTAKKGKKKKKKKKEGDLVLTNFFSHYPFLMPATLLSRESQEKFHYQLLAKENVGNRETFKISVEPKEKAKGVVNHGVVWVDVTDGSVLKIELDPRALSGIRTLQLMARRKGAKLKVTDIHWFEEEKKQIRFPSKTEISEVKLAVPGSEGRQLQEVEHSRTIFAYKDYRFFKVNVNVVDEADQKVAK